MTQQPFSRPGAIDLSALKRPSPAHNGPQATTGGGTPGGAAYWLEVSEQNFQETIEASLKAPVLLAFYSPSRLPESERMARDLATVAGEYEGRFFAGLVDIDTAPAIAQAVQLPSVPYVFALLDGRPAPLLQQMLGIDDLRATINQLMQQLTAQGMTTRHQPRSVEGAAADQADPDEVDAQTMVADLDMLGGHVDDAFNRLIELVRRTSGDERNRAREHLLG